MMQSLQDLRCLILGSGDMGRAHAAVVQQLGLGAVGLYAPSERNRAAVEALGATFFTGDVTAAVQKFAPTHVIVATPVETLASSALRALELGVKAVLIEKPAMMSRREAEALASAQARTGAAIHVGYNRRYYASVRKALAMIAESGEPITSVTFEFTEWADVIRGLTNQAKETKALWLLANSLHVIDLALHPVGMPDSARSHFVASGKLDWHSTSVFVGSGVTGKGVPFSYCANWDGPGRWGAKWVTPSTRYVFRPLEKLHVVRRGSVAVTEIDLGDNFDGTSKPGVYLQDRAFLTGQDAGGLATLEQAIALFELAGRMGGYGL